MLHWLIKILRPRWGWLALILLLATAVCLPLSFVESRWLIGAPALVSVSLLAAWLGLMCGQTRLPGWLIGLFGALTGIEWNAMLAGRLLPGWGAIGREVMQGVRWLAAGLHGEWTAEVPFVWLAWDVWARILALLERLVAWSQAGLTDTASYDSLVLLLFAGIGVWWVSYFAGWQLARGRSALLAFTPTGSVLLANVALTHGAGMNYLRAFLGGALLLMITNRHAHRQEAWEREGIDYSADLQHAVQLVGVGLTTMLLVLALLVPYVTWQQTVSAFWRHWYGPWTQVSQRLDRLFAGRNPVPPPRTAAAGGRGPEAHSLGGRPHLSDDVVFTVFTSDPVPPPPEILMHEYPDYQPPKRYWRTVTFDTYTGQGWENTEVQRTERSAGELLASPTYPHTVLTQTFSLRLVGRGLVPAANEPVQVDRAYTLVERGAGDVVGFEVEELSYTVVSHIPSPTLTQLREASADYPMEIAGPYLALPSIPARVRDLAEELTAQAETPYDKALAIQDHLRAYDYDLEIPAPPPGQDVADYLLFRTRRGYCDYYATAMVVMLRAVGVPARYASGYVLGSYSHARRAYVVTQREAHAWVEVYFPGYGWVEFEPTPYRTVFTRPVGGEVSIPTPAWAVPRDAPPASRALSTGLVLAVAALSLGGVFMVALSVLRARRGFSSRQLAMQLYGRMVRWADRVRLGPHPGDTPLEFATRLGRAVEERGPWAEGAAQEAQMIGRTYVQARYAAEPLSAREAGQALTAWEKLHDRLRWLFIRRW